jgi:predicted nucleic acid-binding protein
MKIVVPDASVLLKWVIPTAEEGRDAAIDIRGAAIEGRIALLVPPLWLYEVGNTLARRFPDHAARLLGALVDFGFVEMAATDEWLDRALALTSAHAVTFYDATYHALALVEGGVFVTADSDYIRKTRSAGAVQLLGAQL